MPKAITHLGELTPDPQNARRHTPRNVGLIEDALHEVGAARSIVIDENGVVLAGNATIEAAAAAGIERVQVVDADGETIVAVRRSGLSEAQKTRLALYDNRAAELAEWDTTVLAGLVESAPETVAGLWGDEELEALIEAAQPVAEAAEDPGAQMDRAEELREAWQTARGQLWEIPSLTVPGKCHRLLCGDSTSAEDVARLMGGERAGAVVTDSPYGIGREGITNDDEAGLLSLFDGVLSALPTGDAVIINFQSPRLVHVWMDALRAAGHSFRRLLWMYDENDQTKPWHYWLMCSQAIAVSTVGTPEWADCRAHHDTYVIGLSQEWRSGGAGNDFAHASVKPVGLVADLMMHTTGLVYDPFLGSGTTMVAAEQTGRLCYGMEIEPKYVAVTLQRLSDMGLSPRLIDSNPKGMQQPHGER